MNQGKQPAYDQAHVLVVDDDQGVCEFFLDLFEEMGVKVDLANSGTTGLKYVYTRKYKLIFLDIKLGDRNGLEVLEGIRKVDKQVKIVMISGYLTEKNIERALQSGADGYLYKPLQVRDIMAQTFRHVPVNDLRNPASKVV